MLASCSIQKRHYRRGYYIDWSQRTEKATVDGHFNKLETDSVLPESIVESAPELSQSVGGVGKCDTLYNVKDEKFIIKALRIDSLELTYLDCNNPGSDTLRLKLKRVDKIVYANGMIDYYEFPKPQGYANVRESVDKKRISVYQLERINKRAKKATNPFLAYAIFLMIASPIAFLNFGFMLLIFGSAGLSLIKAYELTKKNGDKYSGSGSIDFFAILLSALLLITIYLYTSL